MALINKLEAIGDAVRAKTGDTNKLTLDEMATKINGIKPGPTTSDLIITGDCQYRFANGGWDWVIEKYGDQITTHDITSIDWMFSNFNADKIPFSINLSDNKREGFRMHNVFYRCTNLTELPYIENAVPRSIQQFVTSIPIQQVPENYFDNWNWKIMKNMVEQFDGYADSLFQGCTKLRKLPLAWLANMNPNVYYSYSYFFGGFAGCAVLDELLELPIPYIGVWMSNAFRSFCQNTYRIKNITFAPTGPKKWKNQDIALHYNIGWGPVKNIGMDKRVVDDATYAALKNDPDWWTEDVLYSHYNHDSAVATINSLPDTSEYLATAGGSNTISFRGVAGKKTDGGAINTLTAEEIAVAAAKGWTVALV